MRTYHTRSDTGVSGASHAYRGPTFRLIETIAWEDLTARGGFGSGRISIEAGYFMIRT